MDLFSLNILLEFEVEEKEALLLERTLLLFCFNLRSFDESLALQPKADRHVFLESSLLAVERAFLLSLF